METLKWLGQVSVTPAVLAAAGYGVYKFRNKLNASKVKEVPEAYREAEIETGVEAQIHRAETKPSVDELRKLIYGEEADPYAVVSESKVEETEVVEIKKINWRGVEVIMPKADELRARQALTDLIDMKALFIQQPVMLERIIFQKEKPSSDQLTAPQVLSGREVVISLDEIEAKSFDHAMRKKTLESFLYRAFNNRVIEYIPELSQLKKNGRAFNFTGNAARLMYQRVEIKNQFNMKIKQFFEEYKNEGIDPRKPLMITLKQGNIVVTRYGKEREVISIIPLGLK